MDLPTGRPPGAVPTVKVPAVATSTDGGQTWTCNGCRRPLDPDTEHWCPGLTAIILDNLHDTRVQAMLTAKREETMASLADKLAKGILTPARQTIQDEGRG